MWADYKLQLAFLPLECKRQRVIVGSLFVSFGDGLHSIAKDTSPLLVAASHFFTNDASCINIVCLAAGFNVSLECVAHSTFSRPLNCALA